MTLRRGFKSEAESTSLEVRRDMRLLPTAPLDPWDLAEHLAIQVLPMTRLRPLASEAVDHFCYGERSAFSAVTIFRGSRRLIVHNDHHSKNRQVSNLAHELSHALLHHPPTPPLSENGCRYFDAIIEAEANWLAGCLLIPREAAFLVAHRGTDLYEAADIYGVSLQMMQYRLNVTGALKFSHRMRRRSGGGQAAKRQR